MRKINQIGLMLLLCASLTTIAHAQSSGSTVVATCGTLATTYTPGEFQRDTQNTAGQKCTSTAAAAGAATSANQSTEITALNQLHADMIAPTVAGSNVIGSIANITGTVPLPTGAATSANQSTEITSLSSIATNTTQVASALPVGGLNASNTTATGNPVGVGGVVSTSAPSAGTTGQRKDIWMGQYGQIMVGGNPNTAADGQTNNLTYLLSNTGALSPIPTAGFVFNGTTWDRARGDTNGAFSQGNVASGAVDAGNPLKMGCVANSTPVAVTATRRSDLWCGTTGAMGVFLTSGPTGNGVGFYASSSNNFASTGSADKLPVMAHGLALDGTNWFQALQPVNSASWGGLTPVANSAVASAVIGKASAGNLFGYNITTGASAGYAMVFNATTAPADGAVTPVKCVAVAANTSFIDNFRGAPIYNSTGTVVVFSTTGCFTKTASATAFISVDVK